MSHLQKIANAYKHTLEYERSMLHRTTGFSSPEARRAWMLKEFLFLEKYEDRLQKIFENIPPITQWGRFEELQNGYQYGLDVVLNPEALSTPDHMVVVRKHLAEKIFDTVGLHDFQAQFAYEPFHGGLNVRVAIYLTPA